MSELGKVGTCSHCGAVLSAVNFTCVRGEHCPEAKQAVPCGREFETLCNLEKGHKGPCAWQANPTERDYIAGREREAANARLVARERGYAIPDDWTSQEVIRHITTTPAVKIIACECGQALLGHWTECHMCHKPRALAIPDMQTPRTKAKIKENLGLLTDFLRKKYGGVDDEVVEILFSALGWTANDVAQQVRSSSVPVGEQKQEEGV